MANNFFRKGNLSTLRELALRAVADDPVTARLLGIKAGDEVPGIIVPQSLQDALEQAGSDAADVGFAHARELIAAARERAAGVYLVAPFRRPLRVLELLA